MSNGAQAGQWTTGLCDCCEDCSSCLCSCCVPCIPVGEIVNVLDEGQTSCLVGGCIFFLLQSCAGMGCLYTCLYRKKLRQRYNLPEEPCIDLITDWCCLCCSIAQTYRELKNRNIDPAKGYAPPPIQPSVPTTQFMQR